MPFFSTFSGSFTSGRRRRHGNQPTFESLGDGSIKPHHDADVVVHLQPNEDRRFASHQLITTDPLDDFSLCKFQNWAAPMFMIPVHNTDILDYGGSGNPVSNTPPWKYGGNDSIEGTTQLDWRSKWGRGAIHFGHSSNTRRIELRRWRANIMNTTGHPVVSGLTDDPVVDSVTYTDHAWNTENSLTQNATWRLAAQDYSDLDENDNSCIWKFGNSATASASTNYPHGTYGDFTWEMWLYRESGATRQSMDIMPGDGYGDQHVIRITHNTNYNYDGGLEIVLDNASTLPEADRYQRYLDSRASILNSGGGPITTNTWHHLAITRENGQTVRCFVNGQQQDFTFVNANGQSYNSNTWTFTANVDISGWVLGGVHASTDTTRAFAGYVEDFRMINGKCIYTEDFTPQMHTKSALARQLPYTGVMQHANSSSYNYDPSKSVINPFRDEDVVLHLLPGSDEAFANGFKTVPNVYDDYSKARFSSASLVIWSGVIGDHVGNTAQWTNSMSSDVHYDDESIDSTTDGAFFASSNAHTHKAVNGMGASIDLTGDSRLEIGPVNVSSTANDAGSSLDLTTYNNYNNEPFGGTHGTIIHTWEPISQSNLPVWYYSHNSSSALQYGNTNPLFMGNSTTRSSTNYQNGDGWLGDFTIEGWIQVWADQYQNTVIYSDVHYNSDSTSKFALNFITDQDLVNHTRTGDWRVQFGTGASDIKYFRYPTIDTEWQTDPDKKPWIHFAITRANNVVRFFQDGYQCNTDGVYTSNQGMEWTYTGNVGTTSNMLTFGVDNSSFKLEGFRIINGSALYTYHFKPNRNLARDRSTASLSYDYNGIVQPSNNVVDSSGNRVFWSPADEGNLAFWVDASDTSSYEDNSGPEYAPYNVGTTRLVSITDKAGNATITVGTNDESVTFYNPVIRTGSAGLNGMNFFEFGSNQEQHLRTNEFLQAASGNHWAVGVFMWTGVSNTSDSFWSVENNTVNATTSKRDYAVSSDYPSNAFFGKLDLDSMTYDKISSTAGNSIDWTWVGSNANPPEDRLSKYNWHIITVIFNKAGNQIACRVNGENMFTPVNDYDNSLTPNLDVRIFRDRANNYMAGQMAEFFTVADIPGTIVSNTDISNVEKAEGYLAHKWTDSSTTATNILGRLDANHPYKNSAP